MSRATLHSIDDTDRDAARGAEERTRIKAQIGSELIVETITREALDPETPLTERIKALEALAEFTASAERAKQEVKQELGVGGGGGETNRPTLIINIPGRNQRIEVGAET